jgi:hypothetical protein
LLPLAQHRHRLLHPRSREGRKPKPYWARLRFVERRRTFGIAPLYSSRQAARSTVLQRLSQVFEYLSMLPV